MTTKAPAIQLADFAAGPETVDPLADATFRALVPVAEPISAGAPPVLPSLVDRIQAVWPVSRRRTRSGWLITAPTATRPRPRFTLTWPGLTQEEADALLEFLEVDVGRTRFAMTVQVDGPLAGSAGAITVRPLAPVGRELVHRIAGTDGLYAIGPLEVEEVF
jgi:hypothetical protein